jgi:hypothetical protein
MKNIGHLEQVGMYRLTPFIFLGSSNLLFPSTGGDIRALKASDGTILATSL